MHVRIVVTYLHSYDSDPERYSDLLDMLDMNSEDYFDYQIPQTSLWLCTKHNVHIHSLTDACTIHVYIHS